MATLEARHLSIAINVPLDRAYAFAHPPEAFARWAAGLATTLHQQDGEWVAETPQGEAHIIFTGPNDFGVLDHEVRLPDKPAIRVPLRLIANGDGTEAVLTLFRQPGMSDADFARDAEAVAADLATLKRLLEHPADN